MVTILRDRLAEIKNERNRRRDLARQLSHFRSPSARAELEDMLVRSPDDAAHEIRQMMAAPEARRQLLRSRYPIF